MKYFGIDYGEKRVGLAVSDEEGVFAFPREIIRNQGTKNLLRALVVFIAREHAKAVVVGLPLGADNQDTAQTKVVRAFAEELRKMISIPIFFQNEILSTRIARESSRKEYIDDSSAALILQSYLDRLKR